MDACRSMVGSRGARALLKLGFKGFAGLRYATHGPKRSQSCYAGHFCDKRDGGMKQVVEILCSSKGWMELDTNSEALCGSKALMSSLLWRTSITGFKIL